MTFRRLTFRSAFSQIVWMQVLAIAATSLIIPIAIFLFLDHTVGAYQMRMLRQHEQGLLRALSLSGQGPRLNLPPSVRAPYAQEIGGFAFAVLDGAGRPLLSSGHAAPLAPLPARRKAQPFRLKTASSSYYGASFPERLAGRSIWIQVDQNLENPDVVMDDVLARFVPEVGWLSLSLLLLLLVADIIIVRRALAPVLRASRMAEDINPNRLDLRLPVAQMPLEIAPLIGAINAALQRLEGGFQAQRDLTADVAHELRTPLAVVRMRVEALPDPAVRTQLFRDIDAMSRIVGQLLAMAELENVVVDPGARADLRQVCLEVVEHLAPFAVAGDKQLELSGTPAAVWVLGQHDFLFQAVRNLVENAIAHTAVGTAVVVEVQAAGRVRVLDHGPGIPVDQREQVFRRFWRKRDAPPGRSGGAGLGLSIVARIAERYGGQVTVEDRPGGGAAFVLALQPAAA